MYFASLKVKKHIRTIPLKIMRGVDLKRYENVL